MSVGRAEFPSVFAVSCFVGSSIAHLLIYSPKIHSIIQRWFERVRSIESSKCSELSEKSPISLHREISPSLSKTSIEEKEVPISSISSSLSVWKPLEESLSDTLACWGDKALVDEAKTVLNEFVVRKVFDVAIIVNNAAHRYFIAMLENSKPEVFISRNCIDRDQIAKGAFGKVEKVPGQMFVLSGGKTDFSMAVKTFYKAQKASIEWNSNQLIKDVEHVVRCLARGMIFEQDSLTPSNFLMFKFFEEGDLHDYLGFFLFEKIPFIARYEIGMKIFNELANVLKRIHERGFIYNDLKLENVLIENESVFVTDFNDLDPSSLDFCGTPKIIFSEDYRDLQKNLEGESRKLIRQRMDIRQLAFLMYGFFGTEIQSQKETSLATPYPGVKKILLSASLLWPDTSHPYVELREEVASDVRQLIKDMLDPDRDKVPDIQSVCQRLEEISSGQEGPDSFSSDQNSAIG